MKAYAYALLTAFALSLLMVATAAAQPPTHPSDPNAVLIGSFEVTVTLNGGVATLQLQSLRGATTSAQEPCQIKANVNVWRTSTGQIDYVVDASSVHYVGSCGTVDMDPVEVFGLLDQAALKTGIMLGFSPCTVSCTTQGYGRVYNALCVREYGTGTLRHYEPCDMTSYCYREYTYCCPDGTTSPQISEMPRTGDGCGAGTPGVCQPTCGAYTPKILY